MTTLRQLRAQHPDLFLMRQTWFDEPPHAFMETATGDFQVDRARYGLIANALPDLLPPRMVVRSAVQLATMYVSDPANPVWTRYLWTSDFDDYGQRVFMGVNGGKMELHRHLKIDQRFGVPLW